jgi:hypothetical protein
MPFTSCKAARSVGVMVLVVRDHCALKVALACLLAFHRIVRFVEVKVLVVFLNHHLFFASFLLF